MSAAIIADNTTIKIAPFYVSQLFASGSSSDALVYQTTDNEYLELTNIVSTGNAGNGVVMKIISVDTGVAISQKGAAGSLAHVFFNSDSKVGAIFVPPRHKLTYSNAVSNNTTIKFNGMKHINTP